MKLNKLKECPEVSLMDTGTWMIVPNDCKLKGKTIAALTHAGIGTQWSKRLPHNGLDALNRLTAFTGGPQVYELTMLRRKATPYVKKPMIEWAHFIEVPFAAARRSLCATMQDCRDMTDSVGAAEIAYAVGDSTGYMESKGVETALADTLERIVPANRRTYASRFGATVSESFLEEKLREVCLKFHTILDGVDRRHVQCVRAAGKDPLDNMTPAQWATAMSAQSLTGFAPTNRLAFTLKAMLWLKRNGVKFVVPPAKMRDAVVRQMLAEAEFRYAGLLEARVKQAWELVATLGEAAKSMDRHARQAKTAAWNLANKNKKEYPDGDIRI